MNGFVLLSILALIGAVTSLVWGLISMGRGGENDEARSVVLMASRVKWQAIAVGLLLTGLYLSAH